MTPTSHHLPLSSPYLPLHLPQPPRIPSRGITVEKGFVRARLSWRQARHRQRRRSYGGMGSQFRKRRLGKLHDQQCFLRLLQRGAETDFSLRSLDLNPIDRLVVLLIKLPLFERGDACAGKGFLRHTAQHLAAQGQPPAAHGHPVPSKHVVQARVKRAQPHRPEDPKKRDQKPLRHVALAFPAGEECKEEGAADDGGDRQPCQGEKHEKTPFAGPAGMEAATHSDRPSAPRFSGRLRGESVRLSNVTTLPSSS